MYEASFFAVSLINIEHFGRARNKKHAARSLAKIHAIKVTFLVLLHFLTFYSHMRYHGKAHRAPCSV